MSSLCVLGNISRYRDPDPSFLSSSWSGKNAKRVFALDVPAIYVFGHPRAKDADARVGPRIVRSRNSTMIKVTKLKCLGGYRLHATFSDGTAGEHDFSGLVAESGPMVEPLRDPAYFARVFLEDGAPTWRNGFDMCPDWLRREIEATGALARGTAA